MAASEKTSSGSKARQRKAYVIRLGRQESGKYFSKVSLTNEIICPNT